MSLLRTVEAPFRLPRGPVRDSLDLYAARLDAGAPPRRLGAALTVNGSVTPDFAVSASGAHAVFQLSPAGGALQKLYSVATRGPGEPVLLDGPNAFALPYVFAAGETRVVYRRAGHNPGTYDLCSVPLDGSAAAITLHPAWPALPPDRSVAEFQLTPDGSMVVFRSDHRVSGIFELEVVPVDGSAPPRQISSFLGFSGDVRPSGSRPTGRASSG
jgi:hypothetical protein